MVGAVSRLLQGLIYGSLTLCRRAMCFLNRKRHNSDSGTILPMHINPTSHPETPLPCSDSPNNLYDPQTTISSGFAEVPENEAFAEWDDWSTKRTNLPPSHQQNLAKKTSTGYPVPTHGKVPEPEPEPEPDYFTDLGLAPTIKAQTKMLVKDQSTTGQDNFSKRANRLSFAANDDMVPAMSSELGEWDEAEPGGWNDEDDLIEVAEGALRQAKHEERQRRMLEHQKRKEKLEQKRSSKIDGLSLR